uniref:Uncharacterized protein n=1 Tax=Anguilla anguilla TaxID=7936 RepID=A0A0E9SIM2_ANGAN
MNIYNFYNFFFFHRVSSLFQMLTELQRN